MNRSAWNKLSELRLAFHKLRAGCKEYGVPLLPSVSCALKLFFRDQFSIKEIINYAFYVPEVRSGRPVLISKQNSLAKLARINPPGQLRLTENKASFYHYCHEAGLAIPSTFGTFQQGVGTDSDGLFVDGKAAWLEYIDEHLTRDFIIKHVDGANGSGFESFERRGDSYLRSNGDSYDSSGLYDWLRQEHSSELVIQERLFDHPGLQELCGFRGLQSMRINTLMHKDGSVSLLFYLLKVLVSGNTCDNFSMGTTGNLIAIGNNLDGTLSVARSLHPCGSGITTITEHPETGIPFAGFKIPLWAEAIDLAKAAHRHFEQFGALGWDIAITADGPKLIEANARWDPPNHTPGLMKAENWHLIFG